MLRIHVISSSEEEKTLAQILTNGEGNTLLIYLFSGTFGSTAKFVSPNGGIL